MFEYFFEGLNFDIFGLDGVDLMIKMLKQQFVEWVYYCFLR